MKIAFNPSTVAALTNPPDNKDITFDLAGHNIFVRGVKFFGTDTQIKVIDNLTSSDSESALSANMGRYLNLTKTPYNNTSTPSSAPSAYNIEICPTSSSWYSSLNIPDSGGGLLIRGNTGTAFNLWLHDTSNVWYKQTASGAWKKMDAGYADHAGYLDNTFTVFGVAYDGSQAKTVIPSNFVSLLEEGTSTITDGTMLITSYASNNGFADSNAVNIPYKRKASHLWEYINSKTNLLYVTSLGTSGRNLTWTKADTTHNITVPFATYSSALKSTGDDGNWYNWVYWNGSYFWLKAGTSIYDNNTATLKTAVDYSTMSSYLVDNGNHNETASGTTANAANAGMLYPSGMYMTRTYNDSTMPTSFGNVINVAGGGSGLLLLGWSGSDSTTANIYYRSHRDLNTGGWGSWVTLLATNNYTSILDSRYYIKSEVDNLLNKKLDRVNLTTGNWNPRGYNLAADYHYNGGDVSFAESGGLMHISIDGKFWQNEGLYRVLDTSDLDSSTKEFFYYSNDASNSANKWFNITFSSWSNVHHTVLIAGYGDNHSSYCVVHCGSRYLGFWGYQSDYNGTVVDYIKWQEGDNGLFRLQIHVSSINTSINVKSSDSFSLSETSSVSGAYYINANHFASTSYTYNLYTNNINSDVLTISNNLTIWKFGDSVLKLYSNSEGGTERVYLQANIDNRTDNYDIYSYGGEQRHSIILNPRGGYVGIGVNDPLHKLHINGTLQITSPSSGNYTEGIRINQDDSKWVAIVLGTTGSTGTRANAWGIFRKSDNNFAISRNSSDGINGLVMTSTGMGLGTTAPISRLTVAGDITPTSANSYSIGTASYYYHTLYSRVLCGETSGTNIYHQIAIGYPGHDRIDFDEFGGAFHFNKTSSASRNTIASITLGGLSTSSAITYGTTGLQYFNQNTSTTSGAQNNANPYADWFHIIRMNHNNNAGYFVDIATAFHQDAMYFRRIVGGKDLGWRKILTTADNVQALGWVNLYRTGGSSSVIKWTRIGRCVSTINDSAENDGMIEFCTNGDLNYKYFGHGKMQISQYTSVSKSLMLSSTTSEGIHFYATIDSDSYIWLGHNAWWSGNSKYRVIWSGSQIQWYSSNMVTSTDAPNSTYITDNGTFKYPSETGWALANNLHTYISNYIKDYNDSSHSILIGFRGAGLTTSNLGYLAGFTSDGNSIKDVSKNVLKSWIGIDNYYWANIKISTTSNSQTRPSVNTIYANNWFRSQGNTGWYNENYGGGIYMSDSSWVRVHNNKGFYTGNEIQANQFRANNENNCYLFGGSNARISHIGDQIIFNTGSALRFGSTAWDWNQWAGLKYGSSNKCIYLGIADGSVFNSNSSLSGGSINLQAGISSLYAPGTICSNAGEVHIGYSNSYNDPWSGLATNFKFGGSFAATHIYSNGGFHKNGSSDSYVLLGGGGHSAISSLAVNYANSAGNADTVDGFHANSVSTRTPYGKIPVIGSDGVMEVGRYIDFHYDNGGSYDYSTRLQVVGNHSNTVYLPTDYGTLALTNQIPTVPTIWYAMYKISSSGSILSSRYNKNFISSVSRSTTGHYRVSLNSYVSSYNMFIWGSGDSLNGGTNTLLYVTVARSSSYLLYATTADDASVNDGYFYLYFLYIN